MEVFNDMEIDQNPLISVIVPIYNVEKYLKKCIDSIIEQTYSELEIILVNDGSTDQSLSVCESYQDERIKIVNKVNGGLSSARNAGLEVARGAYIFFLDSDDWIEKNCIEYLLNTLIQTEVDIVQCGFILTTTEDMTVPKKEEKILIYDNIQALKVFHDKVNTITWNKLYKASIFKDIRFPHGKIHEDHFTTYKAIYAAQKIAVSSRVLIYYRQRPNSIMSTKYNVKRLHIVEAVQEKLKFMKKLGNQELYNITLKEYEYVIINAFEEHKKYLPNDEENLLKLTKEYRALYPLIMRSDLSLLIKAKSTLFACSPTLFSQLKGLKVHKN